MGIKNTQDGPGKGSLGQKWPTTTTHRSFPFSHSSRPPSSLSLSLSLFSFSLSFSAPTISSFVRNMLHIGTCTNAALLTYSLTFSLALSLSLSLSLYFYRINFILPTHCNYNYYLFRFSICFNHILIFSHGHDHELAPKQMRISNNPNPAI